MAAPVRRLSQHEIDQQLAGGTRVAPGIWIDADGYPHFSIVELLALVDLEDTPENREAVAAIAERIALENGATVIRQEPK